MHRRGKGAHGGILLPQQMPIHHMASDGAKRWPANNRRRRIHSSFRPNTARNSTGVLDRKVLGQNRLQLRPESTRAGLPNRRLRWKTRLQGGNRNPTGNTRRNHPPRRQIEAQFLRHKPCRWIQPSYFSEFQTAHFPQMRDWKLREESE